jgi:hypothetical protein
MAVWLAHSGVLPANGPRTNPEITSVKSELQNSIGRYGSPQSPLIYSGLPEGGLYEEAGLIVEYHSRHDRPERESCVGTTHLALS